MAPEVLGNRYEVLRPIGRGATSRVLEAWDQHEQRRVALKVLIDQWPADTTLLKRLEHEAQRAASLSHPNIAAVHAVGSDSRTRFVVTELVDGPSLRDMLADRGPLPPVGAARVAAKVCAALAAAHASGVVHGHLTPANILLAVDGRVKVTDFRLAQTAGTLAPVGDPAADLQGVGRCLVAMLTGREAPTDAPIRLGPEVPAELAAIVLRAAGNHERADRSAEQLRDHLERFLASVHHGTASTGQPDMAPRDDRSAMVGLARSPTTQLVALRAAEPPDRQVVSAAGPSLSRQRRRLRLTAGLVGVGLVVVGAAGLVRQQSGLVTNQALAPASTATLASTTSRSTTTRTPVTTASPATTRTGTASPPLTIRQTSTSGQVVGPGQRIVPNLVGLHRQHAADVLARAELDTRMVPMQVSDSEKVQRVIAQQPSAGQILPAGSAVTVLIGTRKPTG
jgi:serine/threonine protein kinase